MYNCERRWHRFIIYKAIVTRQSSFRGGGNNFVVLKCRRLLVIIEINILFFIWHPFFFSFLVFAVKRVSQSATPIDLHPSAKIRFSISTWKAIASGVRRAGGSPARRHVYREQLRRKKNRYLKKRLGGRGLKSSAKGWCEPVYRRQTSKKGHYSWRHFSQNQRFWKKKAKHDSCGRLDFCFAKIKCGIYGGFRQMLMKQR